MACWAVCAWDLGFFAKNLKFGALCRDFGIRGRLRIWTPLWKPTTFLGGSSVECSVCLDDPEPKYDQGKGAGLREGGGGRGGGGEGEGGGEGRGGGGR